MNAAFLFNSDHPNYDGFYGSPIRTEILSTGVLQNSHRHMKIAVGDVLIYSHSKTTDQYSNLCEQTYFSHPWNELYVKKLTDTFLRATVYAWVIENITPTIALNLHNALADNAAYLGCHGVDFSIPTHLVLYRNSMISKYRILGCRCNVFFSMGEGDGKDHGDLEELKALGFSEVDCEDSGARKTIFDHYDTLEHFEQIKEFIIAVAPFLPNGEDEAGELAMVLEDLNPGLFNTLGASVRALNRAKNDEDLAQAGLSGRRYMEQLADMLFPAQKSLRNGRKVTQAEYKNRLWAFIEESIPTDPKKISELGNEVDRLVCEVNAALHGMPDTERVFQAFGDMSKISIKLLTLQPERTRNPYYAYEANILDFLKDVVAHK